MGRRSRQRERADAPSLAARPPSRSERRNAEARAALEPLGLGERPTAVTIGAVVAVAIAVGNTAAFAAGLKVRHKSPALLGVLLLSALMVVMAGGMWRNRYWAVLGFQALLALSILGVSLALITAKTLLAVGVCLAIILPGGVLFYKLIRSMARIQMPRRPARDAGDDA